jgi:hypothetical protein
VRAFGVLKGNIVTTDPTSLIALMSEEDRRDLEARFWAKTEEDPETGCLVWKRAASGAGCGYGSFHVSIRCHSPGAHRVAYAFALGPIPAGLRIRHRCHNKLCVNPAHLTLGTHADNMRDMKEAGRARNGAATEPVSGEEAVGLLGSRLLGLSLQETMDAFGRSPSVVKAGRAGERYACKMETHFDEVLAVEGQVGEVRPPEHV